jgi:hypothetical protein
VTGYSWEDGSRLLRAGNRALGRDAPRVAGPGPDGSRFSIRAAVRIGADRSRIALTAEAADLLRRACRGAVENVEEWEFHTLIGAYVSEIRGVADILEGRISTRRGGILEVWREEVIFLEGEEALLVRAFQAIDALGQEVGDRFAAVTGYSWEDGAQLLHAGNEALAGAVPRVAGPGSDGSPFSIRAAVRIGYDGSRVALTKEATDLLLRACRGAVEHVADSKFRRLIGADVAEISEVADALERQIAGG